MKGVLRVYLAVSEARPHPALQAVRAAPPGPSPRLRTAPASTCGRLGLVAQGKFPRTAPCSVTRKPGVGLGWQRWTKRKELRKAARQLPSGGRRRNAGLTLESVPRPALGRVSHLHVAAGCWHETFPGLLLAQHGLPTLPHPSFSDSS